MGAEFVISCGIHPEPAFRQGFGIRLRPPALPSPTPSVCMSEYSPETSSLARSLARDSFPFPTSNPIDLTDPFKSLMTGTTAADPRLSYVQCLNQPLPPPLCPSAVRSPAAVHHSTGCGGQRRSACITGEGVDLPSRPDSTSHMPHGGTHSLHPCVTPYSTRISTLMSLHSHSLHTCIQVSVAFSPTQPGIVDALYQVTSTSNATCLACGTSLGSILQVRAAAVVARRGSCGIGVSSAGDGLL